MGIADIRSRITDLQNDLAKRKRSSYWNIAWRILSLATMMWSLIDFSRYVFQSNLLSTVIAAWFFIGSVIMFFCIAGSNKKNSELIARIEDDIDYNESAISALEEDLKKK
jgi:hypothetical protein